MASKLAKYVNEDISLDYELLMHKRCKYNAEEVLLIVKKQAEELEQLIYKYQNIVK